MRCTCESDTGYVGPCCGAPQDPDYCCEGCGANEPYADKRAELCADCVAKVDAEAVAAFRFNPKAAIRAAYDALQADVRRRGNAS